MNKFQKIATRLAKHEVVMSGDEFLFKQEIQYGF